jgi:hypothetical protein
MTYDGAADARAAWAGAEQTPGPVRVALAAASCVLVALPFLSVTFPPITDLSQHAAQIRLFLDAVHGADSPYRIQWLTPYSLAYVVLGAAWALSSPGNAGRLAFMVVGVLWVVAAHGLALKRGRSPEAAVLASALYFNHAMYWGLYSFLFGWPVFTLWFALVSRRRAQPFRWFDVPLFLGGALLLYLSHALWLATGAAWFVLAALVLRAPRWPSVLRLASFLPVLVLAAVWYPTLAAAGFTSPTRWRQTPTGRVSFSWLVDSILGGIQGPVEYVMVGLLAAWILVSLWQNRERLASAADRELCLAAGLLALWMLVLPDVHSNTILFASRWAAPAMTLLVLGLPAPVFTTALRRGATLAIVAVFAVTTTVAWRQFERIEGSGLPEVLRALPARARVVGLDLVKTSDIIKGRPFIQTFAYAQVYRGGELNFSFADFAPSLVVYKARRQAPWTSGLEWFGEAVQPRDLAYFDYAIVNAPAEQQARAAVTPGFMPVTDHGRWRLYRLGKVPP